MEPLFENVYCLLAIRTERRSAEQQKQQCISRVVTQTGGKDDAGIVLYLPGSRVLQVSPPETTRSASYAVVLKTVGALDSFLTKLFAGVRAIQPPPAE